MKKIISMLLALMLICAFCVPAFAAEKIVITDMQTIPQGTYNSITINNKAKGTIENDKTVTLENAALSIAGSLNIEGKLEGTVISSGINGGSITLGENGDFQLTFGTGRMGAGAVKDFTALLNNSGIAYEKSTDDSGNIIISCHKHEFVTKTVTTCTGCDYYEEVVNQPTATGSIISQGYPEIIYAIGGVAIGVIVTLLISRKKKTAVSSASAENEE